jgi:hypothetical protein
MSLAATATFLYALLRHNMTHWRGLIKELSILQDLPEDASDKDGPGPSSDDSEYEICENSNSDSEDEDMSE